MFKTQPLVSVVVVAFWVCLLLELGDLFPPGKRVLSLPMQFIVDQLVLIVLRDPVLETIILQLSTFSGFYQVMS